MTGSTSFADAMALTLVSSDDAVSVYDGDINENWTIGPKVHGGVMLALCANAARVAHGGSGGLERSDPGNGSGGLERSDPGNGSGGPASLQPIAVSGSFLWAPDPGPMRVVATTRKRGRRVSLVDVELTQSGRVAVRATITLAEGERDSESMLSVNPVVPLMTPEPPPGLQPIGPGHRMADIVHLARGCDIRPSLRSMEPREGAPRTQGADVAPVIEYWVRPRDAAPDVLFALVCGDVSAPVTYGVGRFGWAPTVQLTAYLRGVPADGWLRVICTTMQIGQDWFDEDHVVVDCEGRIIVQSRQLAMVPPEQ